MNTNYNISIASEGFNSDLYPKEISFNNKDPLTNITLKEGFESAQANFLPYYLVAVVKLKSKSEDTSNFQFHDGVFLYNRLHNGFNYPNTIQALHYFALSCFEFDQETLFRPTFLKDSSLKLKKMNIYFPNASKKTNNLQNYDEVLIRSLTPYSTNHLVANSQHMIAFMIEHRAKAYFHELEAHERDVEVTKWLWCAHKSPECSIKAISNLLLRCNLLNVDEKIPTQIAANKKVEYVRYDIRKSYKLKSML